MADIEGAQGSDAPVPNTPGANGPAVKTPKAPKASKSEKPAAASKGVATEVLGLTVVEYK